MSLYLVERLVGRLFLCVLFDNFYYQGYSSPVKQIKMLSIFLLKLLNIFKSIELNLFFYIWEDTYFMIPQSVYFYFLSLFLDQTCLILHMLWVLSKGKKLCFNYFSTIFYVSLWGLFFFFWLLGLNIYFIKSLMMISTVTTALAFVSLLLPMTCWNGSISVAGKNPIQSVKQKGWPLTYQNWVRNSAIDWVYDSRGILLGGGGKKSPPGW